MCTLKMELKGIHIFKFLLLDLSSQQEKASMVKESLPTDKYKFPLLGYCPCEGLFSWINN
jgi:hypothetical protein